MESFIFIQKRAKCGAQKAGIRNKKLRKNIETFYIYLRIFFISSRGCIFFYIVPHKLLTCHAGSVFATTKYLTFLCARIYPLKHADIFMRAHYSLYCFVRPGTNIPAANTTAPQHTHGCVSYVQISTTFPYTLF